MTASAPASQTAFTPSDEQLQIINHRGNHLQIIACAGSGKTESISRRIAGLIAEGAEPASIIAFTFTERAAAELKERVAQRVAERMGPAFLDRLGPMFVGTIHGYCFRLLQDHVPHFGNYDVLDEHRHAGLLSREYRNLELSKLGLKHWSPIRDFIRAVDAIGNELIDPKSLDGTPIGECYRAYREMLDRYHFLTFSLLISHAVQVLQDPRVFERVHGPLRYLVVDEYQDINPAQERLIELLTKDPVKLCVVGDDDQSIYQWRGSEIRNILEFARRHDGVATITLSDNRRSRPKIVAKANAFAQSIPKRLPKTMQAVRSSGPNEIVPWSAETEEGEAETIADAIERLHEAGYRYRDIAVLFRSVRTSAPPLIEELKQRGVPFSCAGRTGLFLQPEIALFGEIFAWFIDGDWKDERYGESRKADLDHIVDGLQKCFGENTKLRKYLEDWRSWHLQGAQAVSLVGDFYKLLWFLGADRIDISTPEGSARFGAYARFSQILADYEHVNRRGRMADEGGKRVFQAGRDRGMPYFQNLANYLLHYARDAYEEFEGEPAADLDAVDIMTIHQAKGLEWPVVFMPALVDGRFPARRAGKPQDWLLPMSVFPATTRQRYEGGDAEERRLFYVGLTRARDCLYLSCFDRKTNRFKPSPYLLEVAGEKPPPLAPFPLPGKPDVAAGKAPPPLEISFSDVAVFEDCGHRFRLSIALGFQQELAVELGYGKAIHHVLRQVAETSRASGKIPDGEDLRGLIDAEFFLPFATVPAFQRMDQAAKRLVRTYVEDYSSDLKRVWATERHFELHLEDGVLIGRADVILDDEGGKTDHLAIVDYKVATDEERDARYRQQLAVYTAAGRGEGLHVDAAYLHELRESARSPVDIGDAALRAATRAVGESVKNIRHGEFPARPEATKCGACEFARICSHRTGVNWEG